MATPSSVPSISIVLVSKGRPRILEETLESIGRQTLTPCDIVLVVPHAEDLPEQKAGVDLKMIVGPLGLTRQRNKGIAAIPLTVAYIAFFDDDVELCADYLERAVAFMEANPRVAGLSGRLLANGDLNREQARKLVADFVPGRPSREAFLSSGKDHILHGCNMVIRRELLEQESFDEELPLYSYGEDYDISMRLKRHGLIGKFDGCVAVHLETTSGRVREDQRGYSNVANNFYFIQKRSTHLPLPLAWVRFWLACVGRASLICLFHLARGDRSKDWGGRLKGMVLAVKDILLNRCHPGRIRELGGR